MPFCVKYVAMPEESRALPPLEPPPLELCEGVESAVEVAVAAVVWWGAISCPSLPFAAVVVVAVSVESSALAVPVAVAAPV